MVWPRRFCWCLALLLPLAVWDADRAVAAPGSEGAAEADLLQRMERALGHRWQVQRAWNDAPSGVRALTAVGVVSLAALGMFALIARPGWRPTGA